MQFGLFGINTGPCADPAVAIEVAQAAEAAGFDSVWTGEHVVLPDPRAAPSPAGPRTPMLDPAVCLALLAGRTETIALATGIIILPQRNPLVLAKELASVDVVSGGRLWFGFAAGYLHQEFEALGVAFHDRGARCDEYLDAMVELWTADKPTFAGKYVQFSGIDAHPRPVQQPPRRIVGGFSKAALRRALRQGDGFYGFGLDLAATESLVGMIESVRSDVERPAALGDLELSVTPPPGELSVATVQAYADLGVARLIPMAARASTGQDLIDVIDSVRRIHR